MVNVDKHIAHWMQSAEESWQDAESLMHAGRYSFAAFAAHLALEKVLKAHVTRVTEDFPPYIHDLTRLASFGKTPLTIEQIELLDIFNKYQLEGRYLHLGNPAPGPQQVKEDMKHAKDLFEWLKQQF